MMLNWLIYGLQILQVLFLFIAGFFSIESVSVLRLRIHEHRKKGNKVMLTKSKVFPLMMIGIIALTIAYSTKHVYSFIFQEVIPLVSDLFFIISYTTLIIAFVVFWLDTRSLHKIDKKEPVFTVGVISMVVIWVYFFFVKILGPETQSLPALNIYLTYFYPAAATFLFFTTLIIYPRFKAGVIHSPLWYISAGVFLNFLAEMFYIYTKWHLSPGFIEALYSLLFMFSAFYFMLGFYMAYKKYR